MKNLEIFSGWALTEPNFGSDATSIQTSAQKVQGGFIINGVKRWITNGNLDMVVLWARNVETKQIEAFIVKLNSPGVSVEVIQHKLSARVL